MSRFKIGQDVVCVNTHPEGVVIKGKTYTILDNKSLCKCCSVDIGVKQETSLMVFCVDCNTTHESTGAYYVGSFRFAPIQEDGSTAALALRVEIKIEEFELETIEYN